MYIPNTLPIPLLIPLQHPRLDWLEVQLKIYRSRRIQVWLTGHVAPTPGDYFARCFARYGELALRYQDTIVGHLFGHKNVDHFVIHSVDDVLASPSLRITGRKKEVLIAEAMRGSCKELARKKKLDYDDYFVVNIGPSVIPEYTPSVRIFTYNITNAESDLVDVMNTELEPTISKIDCSKKENKNKKQCVFKKPRHANKRSPSRRNTLWSPTGYSQFFIPPSSWSKSNESHAPGYELEYVTYSMDALRSNVSLVPKHLLPPELQDGSIGSTTKSRYAPFGLDDLTIPSWIKFARRMGRKKKLWRRFEEAMFLETRMDTDSD
ncbi:hypothetical protein FRC09_017905 [Ceratobasidium sp. 395]|nr:hypothetical protein FRC09_017905 [Ceratobasidium sp. 395]